MGIKTKLEEANIIIAEFMGWKYYQNHSPAPILSHTKYADRDLSSFKYSESLDELVPVWEKYDEPRDGDLYHHSEVTCMVAREFLDKAKWEMINSRRDIEPSNLTIQQAAAIATAKAIKDLHNSQKNDIIQE